MHTTWYSQQYIPWSTELSSFGQIHVKYSERPEVVHSRDSWFASLLPTSTPTHESWQPGVTAKPTLAAQICSEKQHVGIDLITIYTEP